MPVAAPQTTGCCNLVTKAAICGSDSFPIPGLRWSGTGVSFPGDVHRTSSGSIGSDMTRDNDLFEVKTASADHRLPCQSASSLYATTSCTPLPNRSRVRSQSVRPYLTIHPQGEQRIVRAQPSASIVAFLPSLAFLRLDPAIISLNIDERNQWLS